MINSIQSEIDNFIRSHTLKTVKDIVYIPFDDEAVVLRKMGYRNVNIDLHDVASPLEAVERIASHLAVY